MATLSLAGVLAEPARRRPGHIALVEGERRLTYAETWELARAYAARLVENGVAPGDRVALMAPNVVEFVASYYGILAAGGVVVPVPSMLQAPEAAYLLENSGARAVLHHPALEGTATAAAQQVGIPAWNAVGFAEGATPIERYVTRRPDDLAVVFYTSGTTGRPKGARLTHLNLVMNCTVAAFDSNDVASRDDVVMGSLPLFHVYGQSSGLNATFRRGATFILDPRFDPVRTLATMVREGATSFLGVPTMYIYLLKAVEAARAAGDDPQLPRLKYVVSGGASLPVAVLERFEEVFDAPVYEGYGLSETSPSATVNQPDFGTRPGSIGHPQWGVDVEIADPAVLDRIEFVPDGERGEIVVRGHNVFEGYLDDPDATALALVDDWFRTGDIGVRDAEGFLHVVDRTKDLIIRGGYNVYPREVEEVVARHPDVDQVAVVGVPDADLGEEVCAVVVVKEGRHLDAAEIVAYSRERLAHHKHPRRVEVVESLPMGPSMKVLKRELRARFS